MNEYKANKKAERTYENRAMKLVAATIILSGYPFK